MGRVGRTDGAFPHTVLDSCRGRRAQCARATRSPAPAGDRGPGELAARRCRGTARRRRARSLPLRRRRTGRRRGRGRPGVSLGRPGPTPCAPSCSSAGCASPASRSSASRWPADGPPTEPALDLHAGVAELIDGGRRRTSDPRAGVRHPRRAGDRAGPLGEGRLRRHRRRPAARRRPGPARPHRAALPPDRRRHGRGGRGREPARPAARRRARCWSTPSARSPASSPTSS